MATIFFDSEEDMSDMSNNGKGVAYNVQKMEVHRYPLLITRTWFFAIILLFVPFVSMAQFSGGDGSEGDPYSITTPEQLTQLSTFVNENNTDYNSKYYRFDTDIDLSDYGDNFNDGKGWIPIGHNYYCSFKGHFDGNNKTISNLYINNNEYDCTGLFGFINNGTAKNVKMENVNVTGNNNVGVVAGQSTGNISAITLQLPNVSGNDNVGSIAGQSTGSIYNITVLSPNMFGYDNVGGVAGYISNGTLTNAYNAGRVSSSGTGRRGVIGVKTGGITNAANLYFDSTTSNATDANATGITTAQLINGLPTGFTSG